MSAKTKDCKFIVHVPMVFSLKMIVETILSVHCYFVCDLCYILVYVRTVIRVSWSSYNFFVMMSKGNMLILMSFDW